MTSGSFVVMTQSKPKHQQIIIACCMLFGDLHCCSKIGHHHSSLTRFFEFLNKSSGMQTS
jgi:hypothetical protein